jgi:hypothetical protein
MTDTDMNRFDPTRYWRKLANVPKEHLKGFAKQGGFKGTDIKPQWRIQVMTEVFGPCGLGWTMTKPEFTMQGTTCHCTVGVMIREPGGEWSQAVWGVGGTVSGRSDDELFKMSYTDALGNALVKLGVASDIYMGYFDGSKYVRQTTDEDAPEAEEGVQPKKSAYQAKKEGYDEEFKRIRAGIFTIEKSGSMEDLILFWKSNYPKIKAMPEGWVKELTEEKDRLKAEFEAATRKPLSSSKQQGFDPDTGEVQ